jgi:hypothetical protein
MFPGFAPISPIVGSGHKRGFQLMYDPEEHILTADLRSTRVNEYPQRSKERKSFQSQIKPGFETPEGLFRNAPIRPKKKQIKTPKSAREVTMLDVMPIERKAMGLTTPFKMMPNDETQIETEENSRMFRVDGGTAVFFSGGKSWRISADGEFYIPRGESAMISTLADQEVVIREILT